MTILTVKMLHNYARVIRPTYCTKLAKDKNPTQSSWDRIDDRPICHINLIENMGKNVSYHHKMLMFLFLAQGLGDSTMTILPNPGLSAKSGKKYLPLFRQMQHVPWHHTRIWRIRMYPYSTGSSTFVSDLRRRRVLIWRYGKPHTDLIHIILRLPYLEDKQHTLPKQTSKA